MLDDEIALIRRARSGDERAFARLVDEYQGVIYNLTLRMSGSADDARDLTQNAFVKAWRHLDHFDERRRFFSWIYRIALNETLNFVQRRRRHDELDEQTPDGARGPEGQALASDLERHVQDAIEELTPEHRQVIVMRHFQELSYQEIAGILSLPEKTVKSRLFSARQRLAAVLSRRGVAAV